MTREDAIAALVSLPEVQRISVAALKPTDVIVINLDAPVERQQIERMRAVLKEIWPDNKIVVLDKGIELRVVDGADGSTDIGADVPGGGAV